MPVDVTVKGAEEFERVARQLREIGDKELRRELYRGLNRATKPIKQAMKASALANLPKRGGVNKFVAGSRLTTKSRGGGKNPGVSIVAKKGDSDIRSIDKGRLRHPVFGNRNVWVTQSVPPGWFTNPAKDGADDARRSLVEVLEDIARKIAAST